MLCFPRALLALALPALAAAAPAAPPAPPAEHAPETRVGRYSAYEEAAIAEALATLGLRRAEAPEGKTVESLHTVRLQVIEERDPAPRFLNVFHVLTRGGVIEREALLRPGKPWRQALADETRRNLAAQPQLSLVLLVAAEGSAPDRVRVVAITKDVWSLRLNWDVALTNGTVEGLTVNPSETNFLGTHQSVGILFNWLPRSYSVGGRYVIPRLRGSRVAASLDASAVFDDTGAREGSFGAAQVTQPLRSSRTAWSWGASAAWLDEVTRLYSQGRVASFALDPRTRCAQPSSLCLPWSWRTDVAEASLFVTRSFGWAVKHDFTLGVAAARNRFSLPDTLGFDAATVAAFAASRLPVSDDRVGPYAQYALYTTDHRRVLDLETLALQEDFRLGPRAYLRVYPLLRALGSSRDLAGLGAGLSYTAPIGDGLARAGVEPIAEIETGSGRVADGSVLATVRLASPRWRPGRLVLDGVLLNRYANHLNRSSSLGGQSRLRGYPTRFLVGSDVVAVNVEYRTRPLQLFRTVQLGGAAFYDAGDAFERWDAIELRQSVGFGARILFPQLDRTVFRIDVGFPLARPIPLDGSPVNVVATFDQAFPLGTIQPRTAISR